MAMGHPLLEAVVDTILTRYAQNAIYGATFADPGGKKDGVIWFAATEIKDGKNEVAGKRLFAVYQNLKVKNQKIDQPASLSFISPAILWDLKPLPSKKEAQAETPRDENAVVSLIINEGVENYKRELLDRRQRDARIKEKYGIRSLDSMIAESDGKLASYYERQMKGENIPEVTIQNEQRKKEDLERKRQRLQKEIEAETHLYSTVPKILGAVRVIPEPSQADMVSDLPAQAGEEIEQIGVRVAMEYEKAHGRTPEDLSLQNLGYDLRSCDDKGNYRYIEVKRGQEKERLL